MSYQGDIEGLRATLALLSEQGLLERVQAIGPDGVRFYPVPPPKVVELSPQQIADINDKARESQEAWERRLRGGAAPSFAPRKVGG